MARRSTQLELDGIPAPTGGRIPKRRRRSRPHPADRESQLELVTRYWREGRARALEHAGKKHRKKQRKAWRDDGTVARDGFRPAPEPPHRNGVAMWHAHRAAAQRERFERLEKCGQIHKGVVACPHCGSKHETPIGCGGRFICQHCRVETAKRWRADFERKRLGVMWALDMAGLTRRHLRADRWMPKLLTLTIPHDSDQPRVRIQQLKKAWNLFRRELVKHVRNRVSECAIPDELTIPSTGEVLDDLMSLFHYCRVLEWTPGSDGLGHPHMHVWLVSPKLDRDAVKLLWDGAVAKVLARPVSCIVDLRAARPDVARELVKYLTKDWSDTGKRGERVPVEVYGQVWAELEGQRTRQTSAGFSRFELERIRVCEDCGHELRAWRFWLEPVNPVPEAQVRADEPLPEIPSSPTLARGDPATSYDRWLARRDAAWESECWAELRILSGRLRKALNGRSSSALRTKAS